MKQDEPSIPNIEIERVDDPVLKPNLNCYRELSSIAAMSGIGSSKTSALHAKDYQSFSTAKNYIVSNSVATVPQNIPIMLPKV